MSDINIKVTPPEEVPPSAINANQVDEFDEYLRRRTKTNVNRMFIWSIWSIWGLAAIVGLLWFVNFLSPPWLTGNWLWLTQEQMDKIQYFFTGVFGAKIVQAYANKHI